MSGFPTWKEQMRHNDHLGDSCGHRIKAPSLGGAVGRGTECAVRQDTA